MEADSEYEIEKSRDAVQMIETIQSMIDVSADRLEGLRTQCSTSAELTQQEIRTLEGKLVKHFSRQLVIKMRFSDELKDHFKNIPCLAQWLRVVGLSPESIKMVCSHVPSIEVLRERSDYELRVLLASARDEEARRLCRAMQRLRTYIDALIRGEGGADIQLYWDSWERRGSPRPRAARVPRASLPGDRAADRAAQQFNAVDKCPMTPKQKQNSQLPAPTSLTKSRSHESQLAGRPDVSDLSDNSQSSTGASAAAGEGSPPATPRDLDSSQASRTQHNNLSSPRAVTRCMAHDIAHRFARTFNMIATCDFCDKQILFGSGLKCKECKFKCHRDCESKVPPSCGLPPEFVVAFKEKFHKDSGYCVSGAGSPRAGGFFSSLTHRPRRRNHAPTPTHQSMGRESSSNTSSCNSSTPSSPALAPSHPPPPPAHTHAPRHFQFPEVSLPNVNCSSPSQSPARAPPSSAKEDFTSSIKSEGVASLSGSGSTDSGGVARADSVDSGGAGDTRWPRQNSLSMKEWDIPYEELKLFEVIGRGRCGTVYRGSWHGAVAVKLLHVRASPPPAHAPLHYHLDAFKHEVATFRKTRHENLVLFMGACMQPPRLAIVTALCKGMTLHTHIHLRRDKFAPGKCVLVAQQISQGMGYLHARGIVHKDLKTKNIFLENGKVVITDFGLFSVTNLCFTNNARGDRLGIPAGWLCYLAPELARALKPHASLHLPFSKATDVYAFGTVWYELLCGEYPFKNQLPEAIIWQVGKGVKQSLANVQASRDIKDIIMVCWAFRPSERPDFGHLLTTLGRLPRKRLARSPSHPVHLSRSADSVF